METETASEDKAPLTVDPGEGPYTAPPVSAAPTDGAEKLQTQNTFSNKPTIELAGKQILRPYVPNNFRFREPQTKFKVSVKTPSLKTTIRVRQGSSTYSTDTVTSKRPDTPIQPEDGEFVWDGYSDANVLDTELFKTEKFSVEVVAYDGHSTENSQFLNLTMKAGLSAWTDARVDLGARRIRVKVYVSFTNSPVPLTGVSAAGFDKIKALIKQGIGKYWSREISLGSGRWAVETVAVERSSDSVGIVVTKTAPQRFVDATGAGQRCFNPGAVVSGAPIVFFYDEALAPDGLDPAWNDKEDAMTGAHEFGHSVLRDAHDMNTSVTHKGTSGIDQKTLESAPFYPLAGEIDLMFYCKPLKPGRGGRFPDGSGVPADVHARTIAAESDVKDLISLAGVEISS